MKLLSIGTFNIPHIPNIRKKTALISAIRPESRLIRRKIFVYTSKSRKTCVKRLLLCIYSNSVYQMVILHYRSCPTSRQYK